MKNNNIRNRLDNLIKKINQDLGINDSKRLENKIEKNIEEIRKTLDKCYDFIVREFKLGFDKKTKAALVYLDGMIDKKIVEDNVLRPLIHKIDNTITNVDSNELFEEIKQLGISAGEIKTTNTFKDLYNSVLTGDTVLIIDGINQAISISTKGYEKRKVAMPTVEPSTFGPKEAFVETIVTNTTLLRRIIHNVNLKMEAFVIGKTTETKIVVTYIKGLADDKMIREVKNRIKDIDLDSIVEKQYVLKALEDQKYSPFPTVMSTERADYAAIKILEGRVGIFVQGSPYIIIVPCFFSDIFKSPEDFYQKYYTTVILIFIRMASFFISILLPSLYIAVTNYHPDLIPATILPHIVAQYQGIPTPIIIETLFMLAIFEILRESAFRLPVLSSAAILFVGGLVISQSTVQAGLVSEIMIIVVAVTVITNYVFMNIAESNVIRLFRLILIILSGVLGLYGIGVGLFLFFVHLIDLSSLNVPYLYHKFKKKDISKASK